MSAKLDGLRLKLGALKSGDPIVAHFKRGCELLLPPYYTGENPNTTDPAERILPPDSLKSQATMETGEEVERLRAIKELASAFESAVSEYTKEVELVLYERMTNFGPLAFETSSGYKFNRTHKNILKVREETPHGWANPDLKQLLIDMGNPTIAAGSINATSGKSAITKWIEANPIEVLVPNEDNTAEVALEGDALIKALDLQDMMVEDRAADDTVTQRLWTAAEQLAWRQQVHQRAHQLLEIDREPAIQVRKA